MQNVIIASFVSFLMIVLFYYGFNNYLPLVRGPTPNLNDNKDGSYHEP